MARKKAKRKLSRPMLPPVVRGATYGIASTLRWAFAGERYRGQH